MAAAEPIAAPALRTLFIPLFFIMACAFALGLCELADSFTRALFGTVSGAVGWIPWLGSRIQGGVHDIEKRITSYLGGAISFYEERLGAFFHQLASVVTWWVDEISAISHTLYTLAAHVAANGYERAIHAAVHSIDATITGVRGRLTAAERSIDALFHATERTLETQIISRVAHFEHAVAGQLEHDFGIARHGIDYLERLEQRLTKRLGRVEVLLGTVGLAAALARVFGLPDWRCLTRGNIGQTARALCGIPSHLLQDLLGLITDFLVLANICDVIPWLETAFSDVAAPLISTLTDIGAGLCNPADERPATLDVPSLLLPAVAGVSQLALP